jgi:predicted ABC-type ATPase
LGAKVTTEAKVEGNILKVQPRFEGGYFVSVLCDFMRRQWLAGRESFTFETVMSSPDKVNFLATARQGGYRTYLYYVCTDNAIINQERVAVRVKQGGHGVDAEKIVARYERSLSLLPQAILLCSRAYIFDNSGHFPELVAEYEEGKLKSVREDPPAWFVVRVLNRMNG